MLNSPVPLFLNISALVLRRSISITASDTLDSGMSTRVSATIAGIVACSRRSAAGRKDRVAGILDERLGALVDLMLLEPLGVAAKLLFDPVGGAVEGHVRLARAVRRLEHHALRDRRDDVAGISRYSGPWPKVTLAPTEREKYFSVISATRRWACSRSDSPVST